MKKAAGIILILASIVFAVVGFQKHDDQKAGIEIGKLELSAEKKDATPYILYGVGGVCLAAGIFLLVKSDF